MWFKGDLEHQVVQLLLQQGPDLHHTAVLPSPEGFAGFDTQEKNHQLQIISCQSSISYWAAVAQIVNNKFTHCGE